MIGLKHDLRLWSKRKINRPNVLHCRVSTNWTVAFNVVTLLTKLLFSGSVISHQQCGAYDNDNYTKQEQTYLTADKENE